MPWLEVLRAGPTLRQDAKGALRRNRCRSRCSSAVVSGVERRHVACKVSFDSPPARRQEEEMSSYIRSSPGRLLAAALALPTAAAAVIPWNAENIGLFTVPIIGAIGLTVIAVGLSVEEFPWHALIATLFLPVALFLYVLLVSIVVPSAHVATYVLAAAALALLVMAARPGLEGLRAVGAPFRRPAEHHS
jgi:hypothetical protein